MILFGGSIVLKNTGGKGRNTFMRRSSGRIAAAGFAASLTVFGAGTVASASSGHAKSPLLVDVFAPFSGASAAYGNFANLPGVQTAVDVVNQNGGVLGRNFQVVTTDDLGDPADAIPIANQLVATRPNLVGIFGNPGDVSLPTSRIFNAAHITEFSVSGLAQLDTLKIPYLWRTFPPDRSESVAIAASALHQGYKRMVTVFDATTDTQSSVPPLVAAFKKGGGKVPLQILAQPGLSSYATLVNQVIAAKPDVIVFDLDNQSSATFLTEMRAVNNLKIPMIRPSQTPDWAQAVESALNVTPGGLGKYFTYVQPAPTSQASYQYFLNAFLKAYPSRTSPYNAYNAAMYDGVTITALAMTMANSKDPSKFNKDISLVTSNSRGAVQVHNYVEGIAALKKHKIINYIGASGQETFNKFHWTAGNWAITRPSASGGLQILHVIPASVLSKL
jgi:branched-chain amino acid transport system substrate-binding protein